MSNKPFDPLTSFRKAKRVKDSKKIPTIIFSRSSFVAAKKRDIKLRKSYLVILHRPLPW